MVAWYPGDGNADDIKGGHQGTLRNGVTFAAAKVDQGFVFNGIDQFVEVANIADLNPGSGSLTVDAWIKTSTPGNHVIVKQVRACRSCVLYPEDSRHYDGGGLRNTNGQDTVDGAINRHGRQLPPRRYGARR